MGRRLLGAWAAALLPLAAGAVTIDLVTVGDPGNVSDPLNTNAVPGIGSVGYAYSIGKFEVTNTNYVEFLNAVAAFGDTYGLYNANMDSNARGGIARTGSGTLGDPYVYSSKADMGDKPVNYVSFYDAVRFVNWLENGQPTGTNQVAGVTETGSYTLFTDGGSTTNVGARAGSATWVIPTENEWYKAAYHQPSGSGGPGDSYWLYPTQSDGVPTVGLADGTGSITNDGSNVANYNFGADWNGQDGNVTTVGSAGASSDSYYGTFDQAGNVREWNETIVSGTSRILRGGAWLSSAANLESSDRLTSSPLSELSVNGFRVAAIPEPGSLVVLGVAALAAGVWGRRFRRRP
ncbi:MAG: SUMF1/EgtB/PvdO family nonheme iron enzyme [Verrucomicrobiae bacterium]|nr:SUMF1/EgtB/PvdO family nonheme iron enzyme [Verrucomicrobiae bacterium]